MARPLTGKERRRRLQAARVYLVLDTQVCEYSRLFQIAKQAVRTGVGIVQLRDKNGRLSDILRWSEKFSCYLKDKALFIVNDRLDVAMAVDADGVHLGQEDFPVSAARRVLGWQRLIGVSCQSRNHVMVAEKDGADYIGFGSINKTLTKPDRLPMDRRILQQVLTKARIPIFPIGGITSSNGQELFDLGARRVAVTRAICLAEDAGAAVKYFCQLFVADSRSSGSRR